MDGSWNWLTTRAPLGGANNDNDDNSQANDWKKNKIDYQNNANYDLIDYQNLFNDNDDNDNPPYVDPSSSWLKDGKKMIFSFDRSH